MTDEATLKINRENKLRIKLNESKQQVILLNKELESKNNLLDQMNNELNNLSKELRKFK